METFEGQGAGQGKRELAGSFCGFQVVQQAHEKGRKRGGGIGAGGRSLMFLFWLS